MESYKRTICGHKNGPIWGLSQTGPAQSRTGRFLHANEQLTAVAIYQEQITLTRAAHRALKFRYVMDRLTVHFLNNVAFFQAALRGCAIRIDIRHNNTRGSRDTQLPRGLRIQILHGDSW